jgi:hypothetical protein
MTLEEAALTAIMLATPCAGQTDSSKMVQDWTTQFPEFSRPTFLTINTYSEPLVSINLKDGSIIYGQHYHPDAAAKLFWEAVGRNRCANP